MAAPLQFTNDATSCSLGLAPDGTFVVTWTANSYEALYASFGMMSADGSLVINKAAVDYDKGYQGCAAIDPRTGLLLEAHESNSLISNAVYCNIGTAGGGTGSFSGSSFKAASQTDTFSGGNVWLTPDLTQTDGPASHFLAFMNPNTVSLALSYSLVTAEHDAASWTDPAPGGGRFSNGITLGNVQAAMDAQGNVVVAGLSGIAIATLSDDQLSWQGMVDLPLDVSALSLHGTAVAMGTGSDFHLFIAAEGNIYHYVGTIDWSTSSISYASGSGIVAQGYSVSAASNGGFVLYSYTDDDKKGWLQTIPR